FGEGRIVVGHRILPFDFHGRGCPCGGCNGFGGKADSAMNIVLYIGAERSNGSFEINVLRDDVAAHATVKYPDRDNGRRLRDIQLSTGDSLESKYDLGCHDDRIDSSPRQRAVSLLSLYGDLKLVGASQ